MSGAPPYDPRIGLVVAASENGVIGRRGQLPWRLPDELRHFKCLTVGHVLVTGRKTFESIGRPLPRRRSLVLTRRPGYRAEGIEVAPDLDTALALAADAEQIFVVGGASVYAEALPRA
ncbi:MAG: dihydrofolate reductase, partial [Holophagales bacterium]|nr:dihydrofolate reductase [Holophagales bacterium]